MVRKDHASETPATQWLKRHGAACTDHLYDHVEQTVLELPRIRMLGARPVQCAGAE